MLPGIRVGVSRVWTSKLMLNGLSPSEREGSAASHLYEKLMASYQRVQNQGRDGRSGMPRRDAQLASHGSTAASSWPGTRVWYSRERTRYFAKHVASGSPPARCATSPPRSHGTTPKRVPVTERRRATEGKYQIPSTWVAHAGARGAESGRAHPRPVGGNRRRPLFLNKK